MKVSVPRNVLVTLFVLGLLLPMAAVVAFGLSGVLTALGDDWGATAVRRVAFVVAALWGLDLVLLLFAHTLNVLAKPDEFEADNASAEHHEAS